MRWGWMGLLVSTLALGPGAMAQGTVTGVRYIGAVGDQYLGQPTATLDAPNYTFAGYAFPMELELIAGSTTASFSVLLQTFNTATFATGAYESTVAYNTNGTAYGASTPRLHLSATGSTCRGREAGRFVLRELATDANQGITRVAADLWVSCDGNPAAYVEYRLNALTPFTAQLPPGSTLPDAFAFIPAVNIAPGTTVASNEIGVFGTNAAAPINITGGEYSVNDGPYTTVSGTVAPRDRVRVRTIVAAGDAGAATLSVGGVQATFNVTPPGPPLTAFHFEGAVAADGNGPEWTIAPDQMLRVLVGDDPPILDFSLGGPGGALWSITFYPTQARPIAPGAFETVTGARAHSIVPGVDLAINGVPCNTTDGRFDVLEFEIANQDQIPYRALSRFAADIDVQCAGMPGRLYAELRYRSTVPLTSLKSPGSTQPDAMAFAMRDVAPAGTLVTSGITSILGVNAPVPISIAGGVYSINGGPFTAASGFVANHDRIVVRTMTARAPGALHTAVLQAGGQSVPFIVRTYSPATLVDYFLMKSSGGNAFGAVPSVLLLAPPGEMFASQQFTSANSYVSMPDGGFASLIIQTNSLQTIYGGTYPAVCQDRQPCYYLNFDGVNCAAIGGSANVDFVGGGAQPVNFFSADFTRTCAQGGSLQGEMRYNARPGPMFSAVFQGKRSTTFDTNGDAVAEILVGHADGRQQLWLMQPDTANPSVGTLIPAGSGWTAVAEGDFDGDGKSDILWAHTDGRVAMWLMDGFAQVGGALLLPAGTGWMPKLIGDFNGDGKADILWVNPDGRAAIWLMNATSQAGGVLLLPPGTGWTPKLLADFNGDGMRDILWEHPDGRAAIWTMNGATQTGGSLLFGPATGWSAQLAPDLDGDGRSDIVWSHLDGRAAVWLMNGATQVGGALIAPAGSPLPILSADIDGDGKGDILWRAVDGATTFWLMNGTAPKATGTYTGPTSGYAAKRLVDVDGDGFADIVAAAADGSVRIDRFDGTAFLTGTPITPGSGWTPLRVTE